jgi:hypothetical protein
MTSREERFIHEHIRMIQKRHELELKPLLDRLAQLEMMRKPVLTFNVSGIEVPLPSESFSAWIAKQEILPRA